MTALLRCPRADELVTLLDSLAAPIDPAADAGLRRHTGECPQCRDELERLSEGFTAMGAMELGDELDERARQRIAARVLPAILAAPIAVPAPLPAVLPDAASVPAAAPVAVPAVRPLGAAARPAVRRSPLPSAARLFAVGVAASLAVVPAALAWLHGGYSLREPGRALGLSILPVLLLPALRQPVEARRTALLAALGLFAAVMLSAVAGMDVGFLAGAGCLLLLATGCLLPAALILRAAPAAPADVVNQALRGIAIFSGGAALQRVLCGVSGPAHALVFHLMPFFFVVALFTVLAQRLSARSSAAAS